MIKPFRHPASAIAMIITLQAATLLSAPPLAAQETSPNVATPSVATPSTAAPAMPFEARDPFFHIMSDRGSDDAAQLIKEMELRFDFYNHFFRYDSDDLAAPFRVRAFSDRDSYDTYVQSRLGSTRRGAVYLHYTDPARRELVIHRGSEEERTMLPREAFIQYFRAFVTNPPSWLREGFAIYFSSLRYDAVIGELEYTENLTWLDRVKSIGGRAAPPERILLADSLGVPENFQQLSWALVSFLINAGKEEYYRTLAEILMSLPGNNTARENSERAAAHISRWLNMDTFRQDYDAYINSRRTFADLVRDGQESFTGKDFAAAEIHFQAALNQRPGHHSPYYYLGLIAYERKDFDAADNFYRLSLDRGADPALIAYARGINAAAAGKREDASAFLSRARELNPAQYAERAAAILETLSAPAPPDGGRAP